MSSSFLPFWLRALPHFPYFTSSLSKFICHLTNHLIFPAKPATMLDDKVVANTPFVWPGLGSYQDTLA